MNDDDTDDRPHTMVELPLPDPVHGAQHSVEVLRVWYCDDVLHASTRADVLANPFSYGIMLADVLRLLARSEPGTTPPPAPPGFRTASSLDVAKHALLQRLLPLPEEIPSSFPKIATYSDMVNLFHEETDRAAAVLAGSAADYYLRDCLTYFLVEDEITSQLLKEDGALGTFGARCRIMFALGFIDANAYRDLKFIGKIRNYFSHYPAQVSFDASPIRDWAQNLSVTRSLPDRPPRDKYLFTIGSVVIRLNNLMLSVHRRRTAESAADLV